jgi:hypothetical protein
MGFLLRNVSSFRVATLIFYGLLGLHFIHFALSLRAEF